MDDHAVAATRNNAKRDRFATGERERPSFAVSRHSDHGRDPAVGLHLPGAREVGALHVLSAGHASIGSGENDGGKDETAHGVLQEREVGGKHGPRWRQCPPP